jgi:hypothetical protein
VIAHLADKIARRKARSLRRKARSVSYGKRCAHVRSANYRARVEYIFDLGSDLASFFSGRPRFVRPRSFHKQERT